MEEVKTDSLLLKDRLLDKENELQSITQENDDLRTREATALHRIEELSALLAEENVKKAEEKIELSNGGKEFEGLHKPLVLQEESEEPSENLPESYREETTLEEENGNGNTEENKEHEAESVEDEVDSKIDCGSLDHTNGFSLESLNSTANSPTKQQHKKKKPLLQKFGNLLKKKNNTK